MANTVSLTYAVTATATETLDSTSNPTFGASSLPAQSLNTSTTLTGVTSVPVSIVAGFSKVMSSGTATIDLTALTDSLGRSISLSGLKVQMLRIKAKSTNANVLSIVAGASNGYNLGGSATFKWSGYANDEATYLFNDTCPDVGSGAKTLDLAGTGAQGVDILIVAG